MLSSLLSTSKHVWSLCCTYPKHTKKSKSALTIWVAGGFVHFSCKWKQFVPAIYHFWTFFFSYDSEGRLTNVTFPTGVVTNLHGEMERAITVDIESSSREEDVSITSNLSSIDSFYTMVQGTVNKRFLSRYWPENCFLLVQATPNKSEILGASCRGIMSVGRGDTYTVLHLYRNNCSRKAVVLQQK